MDGQHMTWMLTFTGQAIDPLHPDPACIDPLDIAHALSQVCRFAGHTREFYSVAQHSVLVSALVPEEHGLAALLHDAAEAYLCDLPSPLKRALPGYCEIEHRMQEAIALRFGIPATPDTAVKHADLVALATERRDLMRAHDGEWAVLRGITPARTTIRPLPPAIAKRQWLEALESFTEVSWISRHAT